MEDKRFELTRNFVSQHPDNIFSAFISDVVKGESYEREKFCLIYLHRSFKILVMENY